MKKERRKERNEKNGIKKKEGNKGCCDFTLASAVRVIDPISKQFQQK